MFARLGPWCHDRRRLVLGLWLAVLLGAAHQVIAAHREVVGGLAVAQHDRPQKYHQVGFLAAAVLTLEQIAEVGQIAQKGNLVHVG